jgi:hypothetical protein
MKREVNILFEPYDKNSTIVFLKSNGKDIGFEFALCEFVAEMNHWDMPTKIGELNGEKGYIFSNSIPKDNIKMEILRFIKHNDLDDDLK